MREIVNFGSICKITLVDSLKWESEDVDYCIWNENELIITMEALLRIMLSMGGLRKEPMLW